MRSHLTRLVTIAIVATVAPALLAPPAQALAAPNFSTIDASTPGHASVTITAPDSAYVAVWLTSYWSGASVGAPTFVAVSGGQATAGLETWGLDTGVFKARPCGGDTFATCGSVATSTSFTAKDVHPVITFPSDDTIGPGEPYVVDAVDPDGGGLLTANWSNTSTTLIQGGSTEVSLPSDGGGAVYIYRCSDVNTSVCRSTGISHSISVNRKLDIVVERSGLGSISPVMGTQLHPAVRSYEGPMSGYSFSWHVEDQATHTVVPDVGGTLTDLSLDGNLYLHPALDVSALTQNKAYVVRASVSHDFPDFGTVTGLANFYFTVDTIAPTISGVSAAGSPLYPVRDGYQDSVELAVDQPATEPASLILEVIDADDQVVQRFKANRASKHDVFGWTGKDLNGVIVPAGTYRLRATLTDTSGNASTSVGAPLKVVRQKLATKTFRHTYSAAGTLQHSNVGRCSTLKKPSDRGWAGSLGYYSNAKCSGSFDASVVSTTHAARLPVAYSYGDIQVSAYGGASKPATRHIAYITNLYTSGSWEEPVALAPTLGNHAGWKVPGKYFVFDDRYIVWGVFNVKGSHYDVKSFTVRAQYRTLVPE